MIKNEKQYKITKKKLSILLEEMATFNSVPNLSAQKRLIRLGMIEMSNDMQSEMRDYELLKASKSNILKSRSLTELPSLITEYKIASGLTQKEFSKKIGMKEQQLQRYEAENFQGISFKNLIKILHAMGLEITITNHSESRLAKTVH